MSIIKVINWGDLFAMLPCHWILQRDLICHRPFLSAFDIHFLGRMKSKHIIWRAFLHIKVQVVNFRVTGYLMEWPKHISLWNLYNVRVGRSWFVKGFVLKLELNWCHICACCILVYASALVVVRFMLLVAACIRHVIYFYPEWWSLFTGTAFWDA